MRNLYRVFYVDSKSQQRSADVVADSPSAAASHLGLSNYQGASVVSANVEVAGIDKQHAPVSGPAPFVAPPLVEKITLTEEEYRQFKELLASKGK